MGSEELFTVPIHPMEAHQGGSIVCTSPAPQVYLLTWNSPPDNRLTPAFCSALMSALNIIEFGYPPGVLITTSAISKFYSNGLDLELAIGTPGFFEDELYFLWRRFLTYPMPTIALINGHCFAAGLMLAMHHDYRVFTGPKGYMCLNEIEFGMPLMAPMSSIFRIKLAPPVYRQLVLEAHRFDGKEALSAGLVDAVGDLYALLDFVRDKGLVKKSATGVYGLLKAEMYRESVELLESGVGGASQLPVLQAAEKKRKIEGTKWFNPQRGMEARRRRRECLQVEVDASVRGDQVIDLTAHTGKEIEGLQKDELVHLVAKRIVVFFWDQVISPQQQPELGEYYGKSRFKHGTRVTSFAEKPYFDPSTLTRWQALGLLDEGELPFDGPAWRIG
ncbi:hypothetical protein DL767_000277 [Monosporascus sp. MG133]|nr:hypothetical protein DL767_000277 [Monosporascus sp. MG133]